MSTFVVESTNGRAHREAGYGTKKAYSSEYMSVFVCACVPVSELYAMLQDLCSNRL